MTTSEGELITGFDSVCLRLLLASKAHIYEQNSIFGLVRGRSHKILFIPLHSFSIVFLFKLVLDWHVWPLCLLFFYSMHCPCKNAFCVNGPLGQWNNQYLFILDRMQFLSLRGHSHTMCFLLTQVLHLSCARRRKRR